MTAQFRTEGESDQRVLMASDYPARAAKRTIASGAGALELGTVLGRVTATGKLVAVDSGAGDGSQDPYAVLAVDVDATSSDVETTVYLTGEFREDALSFGGGDTIATHRDAMRDLGMTVR